MFLNRKEILDTAKYSLQTEIKALNSILDNSIDDKFYDLIDIIINTKGRVFLSGIGKPSYIAMKVAATLSSTGTPSFFIHPSEASHGDLGMVLKDDTVILLSNSGGSTELNDIIAYCKRNGNKLVSITRKADSFVANSSNLSIVLENVEQTNPVNSPTSDTIMFMAYLDAIATALIKVKSFNNDNYKNFHPGGKLGSALIKVEEVMKTQLMPIVDANCTMDKALDEMVDKNFGCVGVVDSITKNLVGIITDGDLKRKLKKYSNLLEQKVVDIMTKNPITIDRNKLAIEAVKLMSGSSGKYIQILFVVDDTLEENNIVGFIHIQDLFKAKII